MDLTVKAHLLGRNFISNFSYNQAYHILAAIVQLADTIAFYHLQSHPLAFQEIFQGTSKPAGKKSSLAWSNDGNYLALGSANLELWKLHGNKMVPVRTFAEDFVDIKVIEWSPDSVWVAYGGLSKKNTVKIKNIQSGVTQEIFIPVVVCSISYDPFGKYLLLLLRNNILYLYNANSLNKVKEVPLSPNAKPSQNSNTVKELRSMGWSPDFNYLVAPSLDDSKIAMAFSLSRATNFKIRQAFLGHVSSVSCCRFNPNLYQFEGDVTSIVALGDSHGVVSVWRVGKKIYGEPLILLNSNPEYHQVVQEVEWNEGGDILLVNCMKRYVNVYTFSKNKFGRQLSQQEKSNIIEESYGVTSVTEINQKQLEVFSIQAIQLKQSSESNHAHAESRLTIEPVEKKPLFATEHLKPALADKIEYVKVNQQVTLKDKNNRKKIQPALLIRKDELQKSKTNIEIKPILADSLPAYSTIASFEPLKLKPLSCQWSIFKTSTKGYLELKKIQGFTIAKLYQQKQGEKVLAAERVLTGTVDWLKVVKDRIYLLNMGNLYIFGTNLSLIELPYSLGDLHRISVNQLADIYYISTAGLIKGFNHETKTCYTPVPVALQSLTQAIKWHPPGDQSAANPDEKEDQFQAIVQDMSVESNHNLYISLFFTRNRYFYCRNTKCWISLELNSGLLKHGHSLRIGEHQDRLASEFLRSLTARFFPNGAPPSQTPLQQFESNMIYYRYHEPNPELYRQNILGFLRELKARNQPTKLRDEIVKYLVNKESGYYEKDEWLRGKVREMGGSVVQEFVLFGQL